MSQWEKIADSPLPREGRRLGVLRLDVQELGCFEGHGVEWLVDGLDDGESGVESTWAEAKQKAEERARALLRSALADLGGAGRGIYDREAFLEATGRCCKEDLARQLAEAIEVRIERDEKLKATVVTATAPPFAQPAPPPLATLEGAPAGCYRDCIGDLWLWGGVRRWYCLVPRGSATAAREAT
ncbi:MAG: hypothetical protein GY871_04705 [Actinomycetales bacterium]|nr:hypothetical protein [Actinomycetales bacterium]